jgi:hypothetical protein
VNGWVVRYNTFEVPPNFGSTPGTGDDNGSALFYGNLGADGACGVPEWTYRNNVGETCGGPGEVRVRNATNDAGNPNRAPFYVNAPAGDFRLRAGAAAINRGDPGRYPATDADGANRPLRSRPDAGAYELGTGILAVGGRGGAVATAMSRFARANGADLLLALGSGSPPPSAGMALAGLHGSAAHTLRRARDVEVLSVDAAVTPAQTAWLRRALARPTTVPRVVVLRHGPLGCATDAASAAVRSAWLPLFERSRVRLVLSADEAGYQRFGRGRVTTVVAGSAGDVPARSRCAAGPQRRASKAERVFLYLTAEPGGIAVKAVSLSGKTVDSFRVR